MSCGFICKIARQKLALKIEELEIRNFTLQFFKFNQLLEVFMNFLSRTSLKGAQVSQEFCS